MTYMTSLFQGKNAESATAGASHGKKKKKKDRSFHASSFWVLVYHGKSHVFLNVMCDQKENKKNIESSFIIT